MEGDVGRRDDRRTTAFSGDPAVLLNRPATGMLTFG
jgi:hypothetical protein